jgi:hypothetical protein
MNEKVVFLAFANPRKLELDARDFLACKACRNKTYLMIFQGEQSFPLLQCAACGNHAGYWGFAGDTPPEQDSNGENGK